MMIVKKKRPLILTVFGMGNVVLGGCLLNSTIVCWGIPLIPVRFDSGLQLEKLPLVAVFLACIIAGIGLLLMQSWARKLSIVLSVCWIVPWALLIFTSMVTDVYRSGPGPGVLLVYAGCAVAILEYPCVLLYAMGRRDVRMMLMKNVVPATVEGAPQSEPRPAIARCVCLLVLFILWAACCCFVGALAGNPG